MKLLIIDDNRTLTTTLKEHLSKTFTVDAARTGEEGIEQTRHNTYDLLILDLGLPGRNGYDVCQIIRQTNTTTPIIVLTGTDNLASRIRLLNAGADDYITKPFNLAELQARIQAVLRRAPSTKDANVLSVHDLIIDTNRRSVQRAGVELKLRRKEFDILEYLARNRGRAVTRAMILDHVWETGKEAWNNTVDVHIKYLRDKVDRPFEHQLIKTAYGIGYMIDDK